MPKIQGKQGAKLFNPRLSCVNPQETKVIYGNKGGDIQVINLSSQDGQLALQQNKPIRLFYERVTQIVCSHNTENLMYISNDGGKILICEYQEAENKIVY